MAGGYTDLVTDSRNGCEGYMFGKSFRDMTVMTWTSLLYVGLFVVVTWWWWKKFSNKLLSVVPGPPGLPFVGNNHHLRDTGNIHKTLTRWHKDYGPVFKISLFSGNTEVITGYDVMHEALVRKGIQTGGRSAYFRTFYIGRGTGILLSREPDDTWKNLRKASQPHLKQFGESLSRLGAIIEDVAEDMFQEFEKMASKPVDLHDVVRDTAVKSLAFLLSGQRPRSGDPLLPLMKKFESLSNVRMAAITDPRIMMYDWFPWMRFLGLESWQKIHEVCVIRDEVWEKIKQAMETGPTRDSFVSTLLAHSSDVIGESLATEEQDTKDVRFSETDIKVTCTSLLLAGITTTATTFHSLINILAHGKYIQERILEEIESLVLWPTKITIKNRQDMPYTRAFIYEALRYTTVVPMGVSHRALENVELGGFVIPKGTRIQLNLWALHHDPEFWTNPEEFRPERFLDESGRIVPADHPNRKHLMPFGAGTRVCLGEAFALARLFIWITAMIQRFSITPAEGTELTEAGNYKFHGVLGSEPYEVVFVNRN